MKKSLLVFLAFSAGIGLFSAVARAGDVKFPADKDPAFTFTIPDAWTSADDGKGNLIVKSASRIAAVTLNMVSDQATLKMAPEALCKVIFKTGKVEDDGRKEETELDGKKGTAYYGTLTVPGGYSDVKLSLVKVDETHLAVVIVITSRAISPDDLAALEKVLESMKLTVAK
jgi:hypothetical protein